MDKILNCRSKLIGNKNIAQLKYKNIIWNSNYGFHDIEKLVISILLYGAQSMIYQGEKKKELFKHIDQKLITGKS